MAAECHDDRFFINPTVRLRKLPSGWRVEPGALHRNSLTALSLDGRPPPWRFHSASLQLRENNTPPTLGTKQSSDGGSRIGCGGALGISVLYGGLYKDNI